MPKEKPRVPPTAVRRRVNPQSYLNEALRFFISNRLSQAFEYYVRYFTALSDVHEASLDNQMKFTKLASSLAEKFLEVDDEEETLKCYLQVLNLFPNNCLILNALSLFMFENQELAVSKLYLKLAVSQGYLPAEKNLIHLLWHEIPRWHFRMLNDSVRNKSYEAAINRAIALGYNQVVDLGAGCGLLSLIAASNKTAKVVAFESNPVLGEMSINLLKRHKFDKRLSVHKQDSTKIENVKEPCNLIVTEVFDVALFGERALVTLEHALRVFVRDAQSFRVIPAAAKVYVTGIQSNKISSKHRYVRTLPQLGLENICIKVANSEPYEAEHLTKETSKFMTTTIKFLTVNFSNFDQISSLLLDGDCVEECEIECLETGNIDAFAVWFDLMLDEETTVTTNPNDEQRAKCWEQAIFRLPHPLNVTKGEILKLKPFLNNNQLDFKILNRKTDCERCFEATQAMVSFLNDAKLVNSIVSVVETSTDFNVTIVDMQTFPLYGLLMCQRGAQVYYMYREVGDTALLKHILEINKLDKEKFVMINGTCLNNAIESLKLDVVFNEKINPDGSWQRSAVDEVTLEALHAVSLPKTVLVKAQLINSEYIDYCNKVDDAKALNFGIADLMNGYTGNEHPGIESFDYTVMSTTATFDVSDSKTLRFQQEATVTSSGSVNAILYWFEIQHTDDESTTFSTFDSTHYHRACAILPAAKAGLEIGDVITCRVAKEEGYLQVYCD